MILIATTFELGVSKKHRQRDGEQGEEEEEGVGVYGRTHLAMNAPSADEKVFPPDGHWLFRRVHHRVQHDD